MIIPFPILVVVPSLGSRPEALLRNLNHLQRVEGARVVVVGPPRAGELIIEFLNDRVHFIQEMSDGGPAEAINQALDFFRGSYDVFTWLGDDDWVEPELFSKLAQRLMKAGDEVVIGMGDVCYMDSSGKIVRIHRQPRFPNFFLNYGPQRIAQPGLLFRASVASEIVLDGRFLCAWDQDFIDRAAEFGKFLRMPGVVANYTWGEGTLTSTFLESSMVESALIRLRKKRRVRLWANMESFRIVASLTIGTRLSGSSSTLINARPIYARIRELLLKGMKID